MAQTPAHGRIKGKWILRMGLKLTIELIPASSWYTNLRSLLPREVWNNVRTFVYEKSGYRCSICKTETNRFHCHEVWVFDEERRTQTLKSLQALCPLCHNVKHIGISGIKAREGKLDYEELITHFIQVNNVPRDIFFSHREVAIQTFLKRSKISWEIILPAKWRKYQVLR